MKNEKILFRAEESLLYDPLTDNGVLVIYIMVKLTGKSLGGHQFEQGTY